MPPPAARAVPATWTPQVFTPFPGETRLLFGRVAARSPLFDTTASAGGDRVLIGSAAGTRADEVAVRARGELLERMGSVLAGRAAEASPAVVASHAELLRKRAPVLDPAPWSGPEGRTARQLWVPGRSLISGEETLVPAALVFLQHRPPAGCAAPARAGSTGLAAHPDRSAAIAHAAWEILERDLLRRSWQAPAEHPPTAAEALGELPPPVGRVCERAGLRATALTLPAPGGCVVVAVCLHTPGGREQTFGARCGPATARPDLLARAAYEALMVRWSMGTAAARRAGRRSAPTGPPASAVEHALWAYRGAQDALAYWTRYRPTAPRTPPVAPVTPADPVRALAEHTAQDVLAVDTAPAALREEHLALVRLISPGTRPLPSAAAPGCPPHPFG
ncbi:YcaO-like family protein [Streptomyces sp. NPDC006463]|uniref:YcaO-like family protein n=1 Tax=Streptomyces sp. NPDC006463 TaxID=3364746 RepID=UPI00367C2666